MNGRGHSHRTPRASGHSLRRGVLGLVIGLAAAAPGLAVDITIGPIDPGATLALNGTPALETDVISVPAGDTVTMVTTFDGYTFKDVIEAHYDIEVAVHARDYPTHPGATVNLDTDLAYTPYDIFLITSTDPATFIFDMASPPTDDAVKIIGLHAMVPDASIEELGDPDHTGTPRYLAEVFYGTVENDGYLEVNTTCTETYDSAAGSWVGVGS